MDVRGYVTQDKFLRGRTLSTLEKYLGFAEGRLRLGATFVKLTRLPTEGEFELAGYSMTAQHRHVTPGGLDVRKLKTNAMARWTLSGLDRLIKVIPAIAHDPGMSPDDQYPPGDGVPQWRLLSAIPGIVVAKPATAADKYVPVN